MEPPINADERRLELDQITEKIIQGAFNVSNSLGCGFLEKVYENALFHELRKMGLRVHQQAAVKVIYDGVEVGEYIADLLVEDRIIVELKAVKALDNVHVAQCMNYLKATGLSVCLLMNFAKPRVEFRRIVRDF